MWNLLFQFTNMCFSERILLTRLSYWAIFPAAFTAFLISVFNTTFPLTPSFHHYKLNLDNKQLEKRITNSLAIFHFGLIICYLMHYLRMISLQQLLIQFLHYPHRIYSYGYHTGWEGERQGKGRLIDANSYDF